MKHEQYYLYKINTLAVQKFNVSQASIWICYKKQMFKYPSVQKCKAYGLMFDPLHM